MTGNWQISQLESVLVVTGLSARFQKRLQKGQKAFFNTKISCRISYPRNIFSIGAF